MPKFITDRQTGICCFNINESCRIADIGVSEHLSTTGDNLAQVTKFIAENYIYPDLLFELAEEIREYSIRGGQVFVSTHSPDFVNAIQLEELIIIEKGDNGFSQIKSAKKDELVSNLFNDGNQLGWLW